MADNINTIIGKDATIEGKLEIQGHLRIDGLVKGHIHCHETTTVGPEGKVEADIETRTAVITGEVTGNINAEDRLELQAKSVVKGDIKTKSLVVEQGALFHGSCQMRDNHQPKTADNINK